MVSTIVKNIVRRTPLYTVVRRSRYTSLYWGLLHSGNLNPPPYEVKRLTLLMYAKLFNISTLVETGTYMGDTVEALRCDFENIYSIELQSEFYERAKERFAGCNHISIIHGDSAQVLPGVLKEIKSPCLFWLDGHYSSGSTAKGTKSTPILEELDHIFSMSPHDHVILIDDARHFVGRNDYPTLEELKKFILQKRPSYFFDVRHDIIRANKIEKPELY